MCHGPRFTKQAAQREQRANAARQDEKKRDAPQAIALSRSAPLRRAWVACGYYFRSIESLPGPATASAIRPPAMLTFL
jgi:hypothetical protein